MRFLSFIALFVLGFISKAQSPTMPIEWYTQMQLERQMLNSHHEIQYDLQPFFSWDIDQYSSNVKEEKGLWKWENENAAFRIMPLIGIAPNVSSSAVFGNSLNYSLQGGARIEASYKKRFYIEVDGLVGMDNPTGYLSAIYDSLTVVPGFGLMQKSGQNYKYNQLGFAAAYRASKHFTIIAGRGKNKLGEGYRSLYLSDFASNNNYLKLDLKVWKFRYQVIYNEYRQPASYKVATYPMTTKYASTHYLSLNVSKRWSLNAFETVVWANTAGSVSRGLDLNYLNPLIFFRPVEYSLGSADNSIMGAGATYKPARGMSLYLNMVIDEFLFGEVIAPIRNFRAGSNVYQTGSENNKQGYQLGFKYHEPFKLKDVSMIVEANTIRPYTFAHGSIVQSYTHMSQSLAHPLGANFVEYLLVATWQPKDWIFGLKAFYHRKGYTFSSLSMGEDPMKPLPDVNTSNRNYGNFITQGHRQDVFNVQLDAQYVLVRDWNLRLVGGLHWRKVRSADPNQTTMFSLGIQSSFWNVEQGL